MRPQLLARATVFGMLMMSAWLWGQDAHAQRAPSTHQIFITALELKGSTTTDKLAPPSINPGELSKGYSYKGPGEADKTASQRWEVTSYTFAPGFIAVPQGDTVTLTAFVVNGDHHDVAVLAPDGQAVVPTAIWQRVSSQAGRGVVGAPPEASPPRPSTPASQGSHAFRLTPGQVWSTDTSSHISMSAVGVKVLARAQPSCLNGRAGGDTYAMPTL